MKRWESFQSKILPILGGVLTFGLGLFFILVIPPNHGAGLPMDDSYIHLDFARNLALYGELALNHGFPSAGTSSLGWDLLIMPAFWLGIEPLWWVLILSLLGQSLAAFAFARLVVRMVEGRNFAVWTPTLATILFSASGPLLWYATSGMETSLFLAFSFFAVSYYSQGRKKASSLWCGLAVFFRFEAMLLALVLALYDFFNNNTSIIQRIKQALFILVVPAVFYIPASVMNLLVEGTPYPGTFLGRVMLITLTFIPFDPSRLDVHLTSWISFLINWYYGMDFIFLLPSIMHIFLHVFIITIPFIGWVGVALLIFGRNRNSATPVFIWWTIGTWLFIGCVLPLVLYAGRYEAMILPFITVGIAFGAGWMLKKLGELLAKVAHVILTFILLALVAIFTISSFWGWLMIRTKSVEHIKNVHVQMGYFCRILPQDKIIAAFDVGAVKYLNPQREILDWAGLTDAGMRRAIRSGEGVAYLHNKNVGFIAVMQGFEGQFHPYPFDLMQEMQDGHLKFTYDFPSDRGIKPLPSFATSSSEYDSFISAVWVAEARMTMFRIVW